MPSIPIASASISRPRLALGLALVIVLAVALRLPGLSAPPTGHHSWRQSDSAAIARNFAEESFDILHPRIDWRGATEGYVESEFPVYPAIVATLYELFGVHEALARMVSIVFLLVAIVYLWLLVRDLTDEATATWSAAFLAALPMPLFFGRAIMNEAMLLALLIATTYHFHRWLASRRSSQLLSAAALMVLACLVKPFVLWLALPLFVYGISDSDARWLRSRVLWLSGGLLAVIVAAWFLHASRLGAETGLTFGIWTYGADKWGNWDLALSGEFWHKLIIERLPRDYLALGGIPGFFIGLAAFRRTSAGHMFAAWIAAILVVSAIVAQGTYEHDYYWLPMSVPVAFFLGRAYARHLKPGCWRRPLGIVLALCLAGMAIVIVDDHSVRLRQEAKEAARYGILASLVEKSVPVDALVVALDQGNPLMLYMVHRKGWHGYPRYMSETDLRSSAKRGATHLIGFQDGWARMGKRGVTQSAVLATRRSQRQDDAIVVPMRVSGRRRR